MLHKNFLSRNKTGVLQMSICHIDICWGPVLSLDKKFLWSTSVSLYTSPSLAWTSTCLLVFTHQKVKSGCWYPARWNFLQTPSSGWSKDRSNNQQDHNSTNTHSRYWISWDAYLSSCCRNVAMTDKNSIIAFIKRISDMNTEDSYCLCFQSETQTELKPFKQAQRLKRA